MFSIPQLFFQFVEPDVHLSEICALLTWNDKLKSCTLSVFKKVHFKIQFMRMNAKHPLTIYFGGSVNLLKVRL
jgi:hypothetical protein